MVSDSSIIVGFEISKNKLRFARLKKDGEILLFSETEIDTEQSYLPQIIEFIKNQDLSGVKKIGVAVPGLISQKTYKLVLSNQIPELMEIDIATEIEKNTGLKVFLDNDANSEAFGEYKSGAGKESRNMFYATLGEGVGGAIILQGNIWRGFSGFAGEFGHISINTEGTKLEDMASEQNIILRTKNRLAQDSTSSLSENFPDADFTVSDIVQEAKNGDDLAQLMIERTGMFVGTALAGVINLLNIEKIVIGGEVMDEEGLTLEAIKKSAGQRSFEPCFEITDIVAAELKEKSSAIGIALMAAEYD